MAGPVAPVSNTTHTGLPDHHDSTESDITVNAVFDILLVLGTLLLVAIILTARFSRNIKRAPTWYSFAFSWILYALSFLMIIGQQHGPTPAPGLCLAQVSFIYPTTVLTSFATTSLLIQLYQAVAFSIYHRRFGRGWTIGLVSTPYFIALIVLIATLVHGLQNPQFVSRQTTGMFCHLSDGMITKLTAFLVMFAMICLFVVQGMTCVLLYWNWSTIRKDGSFSMIVRVSLFSFLPVIPLVLSLVAVTSDDSLTDTLSNVIAAAMPGSAGVIFATQADNLHAWNCCGFRRRKIVSQEITTLPPALRQSSDPEDKIVIDISHQLDRKHDPES